MDLDNIVTTTTFVGIVQLICVGTRQISVDISVYYLKSKTAKVRLKLLNQNTLNMRNPKFLKQRTLLYNSE